MKTTYIYVFDFGNQIKIGQSGDVEFRLRNIETQSGREAIQHFSIEAEGEYEKILHGHLAQYRQIGEYFNFPFSEAVTLLKDMVANNLLEELRLRTKLENQQKEQDRQNKIPGRKNPKDGGPYTTSFQIEPAIRPILDKQAEIQDRSISWLINYYLRQALETERLLPPKNITKKP
jgi:hypothetical protein